MSLWQPVSPDIWQGRDDRHEASNALRLFQTVRQSDTQQPSGDGIALIGFACDEGVRRNQGRTGAAQAPDTLRRTLGNMASHEGHERLTDMGNICVEGEALEAAQQALSETVTSC